MSNFLEFADHRFHTITITITMGVGVVWITVVRLGGLAVGGGS